MTTPPMAKLDALSAKKQCFVREYLVDLNGAQAAIRAGYAANSARQEAHRLLTNADIAAAVAELQASRSERTQVTADQVLAEIAKLAFVNMDDYVRVGADGDPFVDLSATTRDQKAGLIDVECHDYKDGRGEDARDVRKVRVKLNPGKLPALVALGKHLGLFKGEKVPDADAVEINPLMVLAENDPTRLDVLKKFLPAPKAPAKVAAKAKAR